MCDYTGHDFGASYPDAACHEGYLWDLDGDGWVDGDFNHPCPKCNTATFLDAAKEDAESTSHGSFQMAPYSGAMIIEGAIAKARRINAEATSGWCARNPIVNTFDWPDRKAVLEGRARQSHCPPKTVYTSARAAAE